MNEFPRPKPYGQYPGVKITRLTEQDPRLNKTQSQVLDQLALNRPEAEILGFDEKQRPVVRALVGIPQHWEVWAIQRNGDPASITGTIRDPWE